MKRRIYVVGKDFNYASWMEGRLVSEMKQADLVVFTGGEDVGSYLYHQRPHPATFSNAMRDEREIREFKEARSLGKKMIGICRGAQFLCVMAGGTLVQHQRHPYVHAMETKGKPIIVTSSHHQRQYPWGGAKPRFNLIGWTNNLSPFSKGESNQIDLTGQPEVEMALYPDIDALAIQSHPEYVYPVIKGWEKEYVNFCRDLLDIHMKS